MEHSLVDKGQRRAGLAIMPLQQTAILARGVPGLLVEHEVGRIPPPG
jgi:hypothetical protein